MTQDYELVFMTEAYPYCLEHVKHYCDYDLPCPPSLPCDVLALYEYLPSKSPRQSRCLSAVAVAIHSTATSGQPANSPDISTEYHKEYKFVTNFQNSNSHKPCHFFSYKLSENLIAVVY